jgi:hypothetical protein
LDVLLTPSRKPSPFVIEIDGVRVVAFIAVNTSEARELSRESWFRVELREWKSAGKAIWDGKSTLVWRPAMAEEVDAITAGIAIQGYAFSFPPFEAAPSIR